MNEGPNSEAKGGDTCAVDEEEEELVEDGEECELGVDELDG